jgi:voltage-gated potassium channel
MNVLVTSIVLQWLLYARISSRTWYGSAVVVLGLAITEALHCGMAARVTVNLLRMRAELWSIVIAATCFLSAVVLDFTIIYWTLGTAQNFNAPLTKLYALYITVGTFSTAGTGSIYPTSEVARACVTVQMALDVAVVGVVLAGIASRLTTSARTSR